MVKNSATNAGDTGWIPDWGTKIPHAAGQLSQHIHLCPHALQQNILHAATKTQRSQKEIELKFKVTLIKNKITCKLKVG